MLLRTAATGQREAGECGGGAHEREERATRDLAAVKLRRALRKLVLHPSPELRRVIELPKRAPVLPPTGFFLRMIDNALAHRMRALSGDNPSSSCRAR